jgi:ribosomal protein S18 acetylase RimI-like enzyme
MLSSIMPQRHITNYRPMTEADVSATMLVRKAALDWLMRSEGREPPVWTPGHGDTLGHLVRTDPDGAWVCEVNGTLIGFGMALVRGDIWFLAQLFVLPEVHALGVGQELLRLTRAYGEARKARVYSVVASMSPAAQSLYMRAGMFATGIGYRMTGPFAPLRALAAPPAGVEAVEGIAGWQDDVAALDRSVFGAERRQDHAFYLADGISGAKRTSFGLIRDGRLIGYAYTDSDGFLAPVAAYEPAEQAPLIRMAADWLAAREVESGSIWAVSHNRTLIGALLAAGWCVNSWSFFLTSEPFGQFDRYHPAGGILL